MRAAAPPRSLCSSTTVSTTMSSPPPAACAAGVQGGGGAAAPRAALGAGRSVVAHRRQRCCTPTSSRCVVSNGHAVVAPVPIIVAAPRPLGSLRCRRPGCQPHHRSKRCGRRRQHQRAPRRRGPVSTKDWNSAAAPVTATLALVPAATTAAVAAAAAVASDRGTAAAGAESRTSWRCRRLFVLNGAFVSKDVLGSVRPPRAVQFRLGGSLKNKSRRSCCGSRRAKYTDRTASALASAVEVAGAKAATKRLILLLKKGT